MIRALVALVFACTIFGAEEIIKLSDGREFRGEVAPDGAITAVYGTVRAPINLKGATIAGRRAAAEELQRKPTPAPAPRWKRTTIGDVSAAAHLLVSDPKASPVPFMRTAFQYLDPLPIAESLATGGPFDGDTRQGYKEEAARYKAQRLAEIRAYTLWCEKVREAQEEMAVAKWTEESVRAHAALLIPTQDVLAQYSSGLPNKGPTNGPFPMEGVAASLLDRH